MMRYWLKNMDVFLFVITVFLNKLYLVIKNCNAIIHVVWLTVVKIYTPHSSCKLTVYLQALLHMVKKSSIIPHKAPFYSN